MADLNQSCGYDPLFKGSICTLIFPRWRTTFGTFLTHDKVLKASYYLDKTVPLGITDPGTELVGC